MDINQELSDAENSLRDFISEVLTRRDGGDWILKSGVTDDTINEWRVRKEEEAKRLNGEIEARLIYFANFNDLKKIIHKNWNGAFSEAFGDRKEFDVFFDILADFRNP